MDLLASLERAPLILLEITTLGTAPDLDPLVSLASLAMDLLASLERAPPILLAITTLDTAMDPDLQASLAKDLLAHPPSLASPLMMDTIPMDITDTVTWNKNQSKNQGKHVPTCVLASGYKAPLFVAAR